jgi:hypothetical protein
MELAAKFLLGKATPDEKALYEKLELAGAPPAPTPAKKKPMNGAELEAFQAEEGRKSVLAHGRAR